MFGVYGDYISSRNQGPRKTATEEAAALFSMNGGAGAVVSLPDDLGINGNSHLMMQDNNNAFIADLIMNWYAEHVDTQTKPTWISIHREGESLKLTSPFRGIWEYSTNLIHNEWTPLSPTSSYEMIVAPEGSPRFFRQVH